MIHCKSPQIGLTGFDLAPNFQFGLCSVVETSQSILPSRLHSKVALHNKLGPAWAPVDRFLSPSLTNSLTPVLELSPIAILYIHLKLTSTMSANDYYNKGPQQQPYPQQGGYYPPPGGPPGPPPQGYPQAQPGYGYPQQQPVYVQPAAPAKKDSGAGTGCLACLAGACLCCCAEEALCDCLF
ncbi:hypothetical protein O181_071321 [Austropuccinia psidii MF-1]|uniref:Cysteine-rich transmembrane CYSTM domain-containing protein n=1 Tax=Austropuccinia psidii MF-1 TaxID=1389203 RepID=A0A9Q3F720_9BASI|nr:hypothetical protein [Austropuccinia psidii MF-1]